jgi:hypothetical protein
VTNDSGTPPGLPERAVCGFRGHPQQPLAAPGLGDHHPADWRRPVGARVQGLPDFRPVRGQPRAKLARGHAVRTGRALVSLHTPQRPAGVLRREHPLPQRELQARDNGIPGARQPAATLSRGAQRNSPSPPATGPRPRDGCDHRGRHEQHRILRLTRRSALPSHTRSRLVLRPLLTAAWASPHLTTRAVGAATTTAQPTPRQTSPDKNDQFPPTPAASTERPR